GAGATATPANTVTTAATGGTAKSGKPGTKKRSAKTKVKGKLGAQVPAGAERPSRVVAVPRPKAKTAANAAKAKTAKLAKAVSAPVAADGSFEVPLTPGEFYLIAFESGASGGKRKPQGTLRVPPRAGAKTGSFFPASTVDGIELIDLGAITIVF